MKNSMGWEPPKGAKRIADPQVTCPCCDEKCSHYKSAQGRRVWGHCWSNDENSIHCDGSDKVCVEDAK
jgi:hypothetical protein